MELRISSPKPDHPPSECSRDPDEKEISDDEDDDRNHKHRRREEQSQSLERDALEQVLTRPYRKQNKPFENGHLYGEAGSQSSEKWKNYNFNSMEKDLSAKFDSRRSGITPFSRAPFDQKNRLGQSLSGEAGLFGGRGGSWGQRDSRFSSTDFASQMVHHGSFPPSMFAGRGMPTVMNAHAASWGAFGLLPGIPNGGLDALHPLGLQGTFRSAFNPSLGMGIPRQRCKDFEERGFCLRGDMCPMEHGVNRIVVEDVQSLSQFNLPVSLPSAQLPGAPSGPGDLPVVSASTSTLLKSKGSHAKSSKLEVGDNGFGLSSTLNDSSVIGGADFYDPDQPLWGNSEAPNALVGLNQSKVDETESSFDVGPSDDHRVGFLDGSDNERVVRSSGAAVGSQSTSTSVRGRINNLKNRSEMREKMFSKVSSSNIIQNESKEEHEASNKRINGSISHHAADLSLKTQFGNARNLRKPSQKAQRTLFVNGIPQQSNKRESLLSHFQKFGDVIDIYIPSNSERAFVQFSRREEAEAALTAPDAVMGNRFIKLWWANRDNIVDDGPNTSHNMPLTTHGVINAAVPPYLPAANKGKDDLQSASSKVNIGHASVAPVPASYIPKPVFASGPKAPAPSEKKLESLEVLKEEIRKKQQMLDQKRNDFRRQLDKIEKQATGVNGEGAMEQATKKQKVGTIADAAKAAASSSSDPGTGVASPQIDEMADSRKPADCAGGQNVKSNATVIQEPVSSLKHSIRPLAPVGAPFILNKFKLDNRPTAFKILPPLPPALANVAVLKEHFSTFSDLSTIELDDSDPNNGSDDSRTSKISARIFFTSRISAEKAFLNGKSWNGQNLQFTWLKPSYPRKDNVVGVENHPSSYKASSDDNIQPMLEETSLVSKKAATSADEESEKMERGAEEHL